MDELCELHSVSSLLLYSNFRCFGIGLPPMVPAPDELESAPVADEDCCWLDDFDEDDEPVPETKSCTGLQITTTQMANAPSNKNKFVNLNTYKNSAEFHKGTLVI